VDSPDQPDDLAALLVGSDSSIADPHHTFQIAFGWSDSHLHRFHIHGRDYGIGKIGGIGFSTDAKQVRLADFRFCINERFRYEYDFGNAWQHEVRIEQRLPLDGTCVYPRCIGGRRQAPPEDCGGPLAFMAQRDRLPIEVNELLWQLQEDMRADDLEAIRDRRAEINSLSEWLALETFDSASGQPSAQAIRDERRGLDVLVDLEMQSEAVMRIRIQVVIEGENGDESHDHCLTC
jgi:hypothetical protein